MPQEILWKFHFEKKFKKKGEGGWGKLCPDIGPESFQLSLFQSLLIVLFQTLGWRGRAPFYKKKVPAPIMKIRDRLLERQIIQRSYKNHYEKIKAMKRQQVRPTTRIRNG